MSSSQAVRLYALLVCAAASIAESPPAYPKIDGEFIVVFKPDVESRHLNISTHFEHLRDIDGNQVVNNFHIKNLEDSSKDFIGYHIKVDGEKNAAMRYIGSRIGLEVAFVEKNAVVKTSSSVESHCHSQKDSTWGISRTSSRENPTKSEFVYDTTDQGEGVVVYVLDSGIAVENDDFGGRASFGESFG